MIGSVVLVWVEAPHVEVQIFGLAPLLLAGNIRKQAEPVNLAGIRPKLVFFFSDNSCHLDKI